LRAKRRGQGGRSWYIDETYVKVSGRWRYLYRAIDREGNLLDSMLSAQRDKAAARAFLGRLLAMTQQKPLRVTTDKHPAYTKAIRWIVGQNVLHRQSQYLNNRIEQDHRALKQRYYPMLGFGRLTSAESSALPSRSCGSTCASSRGAE
jgi:putative transposase